MFYNLSLNKTIPTPHIPHLMCLDVFCLGVFFSTSQNSPHFTFHHFSPCLYVYVSGVFFLSTFDQFLSQSSHLNQHTKIFAADPGCPLEALVHGWLPGGGGRGLCYNLADC